MPTVGVYLGLPQYLIGNVLGQPETHSSYLERTAKIFLRHRRHFVRQEFEHLRNIRFDFLALQGRYIGCLITDLLGHRLRESAPASTGSIKFRWPPRSLRVEARATAGDRTFLKSYFAVWLSSLIQFWCERFDRQAGSYNAPVYRDEIRSNTDFRKYDGILRMVLDVSENQAERIEQYLKREQDAGHLVYGVHLANAALMTCLVFNMAQSEHVHFIDGSDGGFAMAARGFKYALAARA